MLLLLIGTTFAIGGGGRTKARERAASKTASLARNGAELGDADRPCSVTKGCYTEFVDTLHAHTYTHATHMRGSWGTVRLPLA